jgi:hypothetical protein
MEFTFRFRCFMDYLHIFIFWQNVDKVARLA